MANYAITNSTAYATQPNLATTYTGLLAVQASSGSMITAPTVLGLKRGRIYDILVGTNGTPADNFVEWSVNRITIGGSLTWVGPLSSISSQLSLDVADAGFSALAICNTSAPSTTAYTTNGVQAFYVGVNQRASYRWVAAPGSELVWPAVSTGTGLGGFSLGARSAAYASTATATILFSE